jgi:NAD(P)H-dependent flavin oxidoreductase YrpB (nitropropane dioxygenase family)
MIKTRITEMLKIKYPILMGGMHWVSFAEMVAAMADAGGMGFLPSASFATTEALHKEVKRAKDLTDGPFGINISMLPDVSPGEETMEIIRMGIEEKVAAFESAGRSPEPFIPLTKAAGVPLIHKITQVRFAKKAESVGADAVVIVGFEGAGHLGMADVASTILINKATRVIKVPVIAAGGIVDGRGLLAALALGADAVLMGTRFLASTETPIHKNFKDWIVNATENDTSIVMRSIKNPMRVMDNATARTVNEIEARGTTLEEILTYAAGKFGKEAYNSGDVDMGIISVSEGIGVIDDIKPIKEIMADILSEAQTALARINTIMADGKGK